MNLGNLIFVANENNYDIDLYDDYDERLACCYCGDEEFSLTEEGKKEFADALALEVEWTEGDSDAVVKIPEGSESEMERLAELARRFVLSMAGYCSEKDYDKWFSIGE